MHERIKVTGQLIDEKPVVLDVVDTLEQGQKVIEEYQEVFPDIFISAEWGYFKKIISKEKKKALAHLLTTLFGPITTLSRQVQTIASQKQ